MNEQKFVYVTYIATTPERVWDALREGELTRQYWGHENVSDWKPGSPWRHVLSDGKRTTRIVGEVLESVPQRRLVLSWAEPADAADRAKHSRVAIDIEKMSDMVRLTVTHDELDPASDMLGKIANGWPRVLASLKSFLETGKPLDTWANS
jgi:uncharacterized protein YndB with AHSA1/START domain